MIKVFEFLKDKDSKILFCLHDSVVLDMTNEDCKKLLREIVEMFGNTQLGNYLVNVRVGKNYGEMNNAKV
jgi:DNA polymerase I-like protein with 3'-5' exonuclease and polymerase domains